MKCSNGDLSLKTKRSAIPDLNLCEPLAVELKDAHPHLPHLLYWQWHKDPVESALAFMTAIPGLNIQQNLNSHPTFR